MKKVFIIDNDSDTHENIAALCSDINVEFLPKVGDDFDKFRSLISRRYSKGNRDAVAQAAKNDIERVLAHSKGSENDTVFVVTYNLTATDAFTWKEPDANGIKFYEEFLYGKPTIMTYESFCRPEVDIAKYFHADYPDCKILPYDNKEFIPLLGLVLKRFFATKTLD